MSRGHFERQRTLPRLSVGKLILLLACVAQAVLSVGCFAALGKLRTTLVTQDAAEVWRGESEERFAQVSVFLPVDGKKTLDDIRAARAQLENQFVQNSMSAPDGGSLYTDAFSGQTSLSVSGTSPGTLNVTAIGVGGDYFLFHPLRLLSGVYVTGEDYMADRVVLDEQAAFQLFGSCDAAGMEVTISGRTYQVAGVVAGEQDFATQAARQAAADNSGESGQTSARALIYMSYDALNALTELPIDCYEVVLPDPVSGFGEGLVAECFSQGSVVQNTGRLSFARLVRVLGAFGSRVMTTNGVVYPYWENAARLVESYAALSLLLGVVFALMPGICAVVVTVRFAVKQSRAAAYRAARAIDTRIEANKQKHYTRSGI